MACTGVHAADTLSVEAARLLRTHGAVKDAAAAYGPSPAAAVVLHAPSLQCGGGFGHAAWKAGGTDGGPHGGGGAGGGLGLLHGVTLLVHTLSFCAHSRLTMEDCEVRSLGATVRLDWTHHKAASTPGVSSRSSSLRAATNSLRIEPAAPT